MALIVSAQTGCINLPKNFKNYRNFAGIAISEDFRRFSYVDLKGNLISGKLPKGGNVDDGITRIYHKTYYKNGNVEDHQVCVVSKKPSNWCDESYNGIYPRKNKLISYSARIFRTPAGVVVGNTKIETGCKIKRVR